MRLELLLIASPWISLLLDLLHAIARIELHLVILLLWSTSATIHGSSRRIGIGSTAAGVLLLTLTTTVR